jgi:hypothetical protein
LKAINACTIITRQLIEILIRGILYTGIWMLSVSSIDDLPNVPPVYVLFGGKKGSRYPAYVGIADKLKNRIEQHLVRRDSSVATSTSAAGLNPDYVTELQWWEHKKFADRKALEAAELVAFGIFNPTLRSRGNITERARKLSNQEEFKKEMEELLNSEATGQLIFQTLQDAFDKIAQIEERITKLEKQLGK